MNGFDRAPTLAEPLEFGQRHPDHDRDEVGLQGSPAGRVGRTRIVQAGPLVQAVCGSPGRALGRDVVLRRLRQHLRSTPGGCRAVRNSLRPVQLDDPARDLLGQNYAWRQPAWAGSLGGDVDQCE
jgi:hypothetical protein